MDILWLSYGSLMDNLWFSYGYHMALLWISYGSPMDILWLSYDDLMFALFYQLKDGKSNQKLKCSGSKAILLSLAFYLQLPSTTIKKYKEKE